MIAPETAPRPAELCASASAKGIVVKRASRNSRVRIRRIRHSSDNRSLQLRAVPLQCGTETKRGYEGACLPVFSRPALFIEGLSSRKRGKTVPNLIEPRKLRPSGKTLSYVRTTSGRSPHILGFR